MQRTTLIARLRADFHLAIISLFGACSMVLILPFGLYRLARGDWWVAALDFALVAAIVALVVFAWRSGNTRLSGWIMVLIYSSGAVASAALLGVVGLFWIYPTIFANFFLVGRRLAVVVTALALLALVLPGKGFADVPQMMSFIATTGLVSLLAFILANRTDAQRQQLEQQASRDALTGAFNRRAMTEELAIAVAGHQRQPGPISLVILDIDHFKRINDQHGHVEGDAVLIALSQWVRGAIRASDRFFRYGGEEFVLLLPGVTRQALHAVADVLRIGIETHLQVAGQPVTVSLGGAQLCNGEDWQAWLRRADSALYRAKAAGRNRVEVD